MYVTDPSYINTFTALWECRCKFYFGISFEISKAFPPQKKRF